MTDDLYALMVTAAERDKLRQLLNLEIVASGGLQAGKFGNKISIVGGARKGQDHSDTQEVYDAKITAVAAINGGIRYRYTIHFGHWNMSSAASTGGTWVEDDASDYSAFNSAEDMNTFGSGTGSIGTGNTSVAQSDGTIGSSSCKLKPLVVGDYVQVKLRGAASSGTPYYTIINKSNSAQ